MSVVAIYNEFINETNFVNKYTHTYTYIQKTN